MNGGLNRDEPSPLFFFGGIHVDTKSRTRTTIEIKCEDTGMTLYLKNATYIDWKILRFQSTPLAVSLGVDGGIQL